jgi:hypothetical protein
MRLQLSPSDSSVLATRIGAPAFDINADTRRVLAAFFDAGHQPYTRRDVASVLLAMGYAGMGNHSDRDVPTDGRRYYAMDSEFRNHGGPSGKRGYWALSHRPLVDDAPTAAPTTPAPTPASPAPSTVKVKAGLSWAPDVVEASGDEGYYAEDLGLRRIAISGSRCFGFYSKGSGSCGACPLARYCAEATMGRLADIAARLDRETEQALAEAKASEERRAALADAAAEAHAPSAPKADPAPEAPAGETTTLEFDVLCDGCGNTIAKGEAAVINEADEIFHSGCAR